jgi:hypothetical protein
LPVTPSTSSPVTVTRIVLGRVNGSVWVARTCSTCTVLGQQRGLAAHRGFLDDLEQIAVGTR